MAVGLLELNAPKATYPVTYIRGRERKMIFIPGR